MGKELAKEILSGNTELLKKTVDGQLCLVGATDVFLGDYGAISRKNTEEVFSLLIESTNNVILNEQDWIMEAFIKILKFLDTKEKLMVLEFANNYKEHPRNTTRQRIKKIIEKCK